MKPENTQTNYNKCICRGCALYSECAVGKGEALYCARGKSACQLDASKPCICGSCAVFAENDLKGGYFCLIGTAE